MASYYFIIHIAADRTAVFVGLFDPLIDTCNRICIRLVLNANAFAVAFKCAITVKISFKSPSPSLAPPSHVSHPALPRLSPRPPPSLTPPFPVVAAVLREGLYPFGATHGDASLCSAAATTATWAGADTRAGAGTGADTGAGTGATLKVDEGVQFMCTRYRKLNVSIPWECHLKRIEFQQI